MNLNPRQTYAVLALRIGLGVVFIAHGLLKLVVFTLPGTAAWFQGVGLPGLLAYPVFVAEVAGGLMLISGFHARWAALALTPVALGATAVHWSNGWIFNSPEGGWEYTAFLALSCVVLFLLGEDGAFALSRLLGGRSDERRSRA